MKNSINVAFALFGLLITNEVVAQGETRQIRKEVQMEMINDEITLTIKTTDGVIVTEEVYTGAEAEEILSELENVNEEKIISSSEVKEEINIEDVEGITKVTIRRTENGNETEEVFFGEDADRKIKELETRENGAIKIDIEEDRSGN